jgi:soluble lytic murein transglycosylase-like protein
MSVDTLGATAAAGIDSSRLRIAGAIKQAASNTGASFEYLLATAKMESNFNPKAAASTSSARGLYQFIDQTWLGTVKEAGSATANMPPPSASRPPAAITSTIPPRAPPS